MKNITETHSWSDKRRLIQTILSFYFWLILDLKFFWLFLMIFKALTNFSVPTNYPTNYFGKLFNFI